MKLHRLWVKNYKNLRECEVDFSKSQLLTAIIGINGSGKSNLIEAILQILIGCYFEKAPQFEFRLELEVQNRKVVLQRERRRTSVMVDGDRMPLDHFAKRLRDGPAQVFYPELTFVYYSGVHFDTYKNCIDHFWQELCAELLSQLFPSPPIN